MSCVRRLFASPEFVTKPDPMVTATTSHRTERGNRSRWTRAPFSPEHAEDHRRVLTPSRRLFGPLASFLLSRVGCRWSQVLLELKERSGSPDAAIRLSADVGQLVVENVRRDGGELRFGDGLLAGLPLRAGWRRTLYVCPMTGRLLRIPE